MAFKYSDNFYTLDNTKYDPRPDSLKKSNVVIDFQGNLLIPSSFFGRGAACDLKCLSAIKRSGYVDH